MAHSIALCLMLMTSSLLHHVISFSVPRRHSRNSGLADALRMLERQRRRLDREENLLDMASPQLLHASLPANRVALGSLLQSSADPAPRGEVSPAWITNTLGLDSSRLIEEDFPSEEIQIGKFLEEPVLPSSSSSSSSSASSSSLSGEMGPLSEQRRLLAAFQGTGERDELPFSSSRVDKKDKEVMTNVIGDARPRVQTRSFASNNNNDDNNINDLIDDGADTSSDDVSVTRDEFKALLRAVERIQEEAVEKAEEEEKEEEEVMQEFQERIAEAREEAKEEVAEKEAEEAEEAVMAASSGPVGPLMVSYGDAGSGDEGNDLGNLFEEQSEEVIPTENGEFIKVDTTLKNSAGQPVGKEEALEQVETFPGVQSPSSLDDLWYAKSYVDAESTRRKRGSKRRSAAPAWMKMLSAQNQLASELLQASAKKITDLESSLDQARVQSYLEDVENDLLTEALDQATLGQLRPDTVLPVRELSALRDAIRVEEMLQGVKADRTLASGLAKQLTDEVPSNLGEEDEVKKRGEPVMPPEVPVYVMGNGNDADKALVERPGSLAILNNLDEDEDYKEEDPFVPFSDEDVDDGDDDLIGQSFLRNQPESARIASLFSDDADQCPAVQSFSSNCRFAGDTIDFEARALCNLHEMCYVCGTTLQMKQRQCDFIYRAASAMLCEDDRKCSVDAEVFLNTMKLKHRFAHYAQPLCRARCAARFLSII